MEQIPFLSAAVWSYSRLPFWEEGRMPWAGEKSTSGGADLFTALASPRIWSLEGGSSCVFACVCMGMFMCVFVLACTFAYVCLHECVSCAWVCMYVPYMCLVCVHAHVCVCKYMLCMLHACILCACACMCVFVEMWIISLMQYVSIYPPLKHSPHQGIAQ